MSDSMTAKRIQGKDLRCQERMPLEGMIPLPAPLAIYIEPTNRCNFRCLFCPTGDPDLLRRVGRPDATMPMDLFQKVVRDLQEFVTPLKLINLYKDGEPLVHPDFSLMVRMLKEANVAERVWTKSNGALLNPWINQQIVQAGLDMIGISVESVSREGYRKVAGVDLDYDAFRENIRDLFQRRCQCQIYIKIADTNLTQAEIAQFYDDFEPISDFIAIEKLMGWSHSRLKDFTLGSNPDTYDGLPFTPKEVCAYPFYLMAVNADGTVSACANDWSHSTVLGNVREESLKEIWNGEALYRFRMMMLTFRRQQNAACADCYYLKIVPDNLDKHRAEIMNRLQGEKH